MKIGIDIDDTISKTYENNVAILAKYNYKEKDKFDFKTDDEFERFLSIHQDEILDNMEPFEDASKVINFLHKNNKIILITSRKKNEIKKTIDFLLKYDIQYDEAYFDVKDKGAVASSINLDYMIDDLEVNLDSCSKYNIKCFKYGSISKKYPYFNNWKDILNYFKKFK